MIPGHIMHSHASGAPLGPIHPTMLRIVMTKKEEDIPGVRLHGVAFCGPVIDFQDVAAAQRYGNGKAEP
jgi:hypothetical protein